MTFDDDDLVADLLDQRRPAAAGSRGDQGRDGEDADHATVGDRDPTDGDADLDAGAATQRAAVRRRRLLVGGGLAVLAVVLIAALAGRGDDGGGADAPVVSGDLQVDAWAPYWAFDDSIDDLSSYSHVLDEVSPFVYQAAGAARVGLDPSVDGAQLAAFVSTAREEGLSVVPSILDRMQPGEMADVLADPERRAHHVDEIVELADELGADGIDIDYETFAFSDPKRTWDTTRPAFATFIEELAARLHAGGRTLTVSIPPVYDAGTGDGSGYWVYDYARIAAAADRIRVMAYDYSGQEAGPIAPLDWVQRAIDGAVEATGRPEKISLGIPLYGNNVPIATAGVCPEDEAVGRTAVTIRSVEDLIERRGAVPIRDDITGEWGFEYQLDIGLDDEDASTGCTQTRRVSYVDGAGAVERVRLAQEAGLGGVTLWALGYEDQEFWDTLTAQL